MMRSNKSEIEMSESPIQNEAGMSLLQVLVAVGVMGIVAVGMANMISYSLKSSNMVNARVSWAGVKGDIFATINEPSLCQKGITEVTQVFDKDQASGAGQDFIFRTMGGDLLQKDANLQGQNLTITRLYMANAVDQGTDPLTGDHAFSVDVMTAASATNEVNGPKNFRPYKIATMVVLVDPATNVINSCARFSGAMVAETCVALGGTYDSSTGMCLNLGGAGCGANPHGSIFDQACPGGASGSMKMQCWNGSLKTVSDNCANGCGAYAHGQTYSQPCPSGSGTQQYQCNNGIPLLISTNCATVKQNCDGLAHGATAFVKCTKGSFTSKYKCTGTKAYLCIDGVKTLTSDTCECSKEHGSCFTADTLIRMHDGTEKPIHEVTTGDQVIGENGAINPVVRIEQVVLGDRKLYSFNKGPYFITEEHPVMTTEGWKSLNPEMTALEHFFEVQSTLKIGDVLVTEHGMVELRSIDSQPDDEDLVVYNLILGGNNTYFANGILVHNKKGE